MASNEDIKITVVADTKDAVDGLKDMEKASDKTTKSMVKDGRDIEKSLDGVEKSAKDIQSAFKNIDMKSLTSGLKSFYTQAKSVAVNVGKQLQDALNVKGSVDAKVNMTTDASSGAGSAMENAMGSIASGGAIGSQIAKQMATSSKDIVQLTDSIKRAFGEIPESVQNNIKESVSNIYDTIDDIVPIIEELRGTTDIDLSDPKELKGLILGMQTDVDLLSQATEEAMQNLVKWKEKLSSGGEDVSWIDDDIQTQQAEIDQLNKKLEQLKQTLADASKLDFMLNLDTNESIMEIDRLLAKFDEIPNRMSKADIQPIIQQMQNFKEQMQSLGIDTSFLEGVFAEWNAVCEKGSQATVKLTSEMLKARQNVSSLQQGTQQLINTQTMQIQKQSELVSATNVFEKAMIKAKYGFKQFASDLKSLFSSIKSNSKVLDETGKKAKKLGQETKKASKQIKSATTGIAASFKSLLTSMLPFMTLVGAFNLLKTSTTEAMDSIETTNMYMAVFGDRASEMDSFIKDVNKSMGLGVGQTKQFTAIIGQMGKAMGMTTDEAMGMAQSMAKMAGDISSFYNVDVAQAQEDLRSALSGSNEVLSKYGIVLREDTIKQYAYANGIARTGQELTASQRAAALTAMVYKQLGQANGDMAKTMDTPAGRARRLSVALADLRVALGNVVLPIWNAVMPGLIALANALTAVFNKIASVINGILSLFGMELKTGGGGGLAQDAESIGSSLSDGLDSASGGAGDVADSLADGAKSAKEIVSGLMGIDELNVLSSDKGSGGSGSGSGGSGGAGGGAGSNFGDLGFNVGESENNANDLASKIPAWMERLAKIFKNSFDKSFNYDMFAEFIDNCKRVGQSIVDIFGNNELQTATNALNTTLVAELGSLVGTVSTLAVSIGNAIVGGIADSLEENKDYIVGKLIDITNIEREASVIRQRLYEALSDIFSTLGGEEAQGIVNNIFTTLTVGFLEGQELLSKLGRDSVLLFAQGIIDNKDKIKEALTGALDFTDSVTGTLGQVIQDTFKHINKVYDEKVKPFIDSMSQGFSDLWGILLDGWNTYVQPVMDNIAKKFDEVMNGNVGSAIQHVIDLFGNVIDYLRVLWEETLKPIAEFLADILAPVFAGAFDIISTVVLNFIDVVAGIFDGVVQVFNGVIEFITGIFSGDLEKALGGLGKIWEGLVKIASTIWDSIYENSKEIWDKIWKHVGKIWEKIKDAVVDYIVKIKDKMVEKFGKLVDTAEDLWDDIKTAITDKCEEIWDGIVGWFTDIVDWFKGGWKDSKKETDKGWDGIEESIDDGAENAIKGLELKMSSVAPNIAKVWGNVKSGVSTGWSNIKTTLTDWGTKAKDGATSALSGITTGASNIWNNVKSGASTAWSNIKTNVGSWAVQTKDTAKDKLSGVVSNVQGIWNNVKSGASSAWSNIKSNASSLATQTKDTIRNNLNGVTSNVSTIWSNVKSGASTGWSNIKSTLSTSVSNAKNQISTSLDGAKTIASNIWNNIKTGASTGWSNIKSAVSGKVNEVKNTVNGMKTNLPQPSVAWNSIKTTAQNAINNVKNVITGMKASLPTPSLSWANSIKTSVQNAINKVKSCFNFSWSLPKPKLPKFTPKYTTIAGVKIPTSFTVTWHKKGGIFNQPTLLGNGTHGVGEAGAEAVLPLDTLWKQLGKQFDNQNKVLSNKGNNQPIVVNVQLDGKTIATTTVKNMKEMTQLGQMSWDWL